MANVERTGERSLAMSGLHRIFGSELMVTDLDFVEVSRVNFTPKALIETKMHLDTELVNWQRQAIVAMAAPRTTEIPAFCINFNEECNQFLVRPLNKTAERRLLVLFTKKKVKDHYYRLPDSSVMMDVICYKTLLMYLHGIEKVTQSPENLEDMKKYIAPVNQPENNPLDVKDLFKGIIFKNHPAFKDQALKKSDEEVPELQDLGGAPQTAEASL